MKSITFYDAAIAWLEQSIIEDSEIFGADSEMVKWDTRRLHEMMKDRKVTMKGGN